MAQTALLTAAFSSRLQRPMLVNAGFFECLFRSRVSPETSSRDRKDNRFTALSKAMPVISAMEPSAVKNAQIIPVQGLLVQHETPWEGVQAVTSYETLQRQLSEAATDPAIERIILDIDSPGGEVSGLFALCERLYALRGQKKLLAWVNESAFSAAYALAAATGRIGLSPTAGVGSIGVITAHVDHSACDAKQGLHYTLITAGDHKSDGNPHAPLTDQAKAVYRQEVDYLYDVLVSHVARYRGLTPTLIRQTQARCFWGQAALDQQLADTLLPFSATVSEKMHGVERDETVMSRDALIKNEKINEKNEKAKTGNGNETQTMEIREMKKNNDSDETNKGDEKNERNGLCDLKTNPPTEAIPPMNFNDPNAVLRGSNEHGLDEQPTIEKITEKNAGIESPKNNGLKPPTTLADRQAYREEILALCHVCRVARRLDKLAEFIAQDVCLEAAKDMLLAELAEQSGGEATAISHQHTATSENALVSLRDSNPLWAMAKARAKKVAQLNE